MATTTRKIPTPFYAAAGAGDLAYQQLRKPSAEVLAQLAHALRVSTPMMYLRAGLLEREGHDVLAAIAADGDLTVAQKQSLTQIYETFRRENARNSSAGDEAGPPAAPAQPEQPINSLEESK